MVTAMFVLGAAMVRTGSAEESLAREYLTEVLVLPLLAKRGEGRSEQSSIRNVIEWRDFFSSGKAMCLTAHARFVISGS